MPLYFAYGSNMDVEAMRTRAPNSRALAAARLPRWRFIVMKGGYGSVAPDPQRTVYGVLWDVALSDVRLLDRYEDVASGLYRKIQQPVLREGGGSARALIYVGATTARGEPRPGYMENVIAAARAWSFPDTYVRELIAHAPRAAASAASSTQLTDAATRTSPAVNVRVRFATPFDRK